ncbi:conserved hypothetical protein [Neospora caninum Liverpool]|uniref:Uncharacterized protein n=1 Tax=Neospora caninum (strain Liverpool) TaxID=572307 RepID=F0VGQ8_NEOCL|nr:conserved hypothetical protein [Neospora caninum Liverpool]CBZ52902.1 conserved hypothetical protein [Neospora caninum Liverpool]|eukprot:XP_003882934.1 conserved hypothetical protein [Neospora caninum Liverpool]
MEQEVSRIRTVELSALRLEESQKARQHLLTYKQELDRLHADRAARLKLQEEAAAERLRMKENEIEKKGFALRQEISAQLRATQQQQRDNKRQWEIEQQALALRAKALDAREARLSEKEGRRSQEEVLNQKQLLLKMEEHRRSVESEMQESVAQLKRDRLALEKDKEQIELARQRQSSLETQAKLQAAANEQMQTTVKQLEAAAESMRQENERLQAQLRLANEVAKRIKDQLGTSESELHCLKREKASLLEQLSTKNEAEQRYQRVHSRAMEELHGCLRDTRLASQDLERKTALLQDELSRLRAERDRAVAQARADAERETKERTQKLQKELTQERLLRADKEREVHKTQVELERLSSLKLQWQQKAQRLEGCCDASATCSERHRRLLASLSATLRATADIDDADEAGNAIASTRRKTLFERHQRPMDLFTSARLFGHGECQPAELPPGPFPDEKHWKARRPPSRGDGPRTTPPRCRSPEQSERGTETGVRSPAAIRRGCTPTQSRRDCPGEPQVGNLGGDTRESCSDLNGKFAESTLQCRVSGKASVQRTRPAVGSEPGTQRGSTEVRIEDLEQRVRKFLASLQNSDKQPLRGRRAESGRRSPDADSLPPQPIQAAGQPPRLGGTEPSQSPLVSVPQCTWPVEPPRSSCRGSAVSHPQPVLACVSASPRLSPRRSKEPQAPPAVGDCRGPSDGDARTGLLSGRSDPRFSRRLEGAPRIGSEREGSGSRRGELTDMRSRMRSNLNGTAAWTCSHTVPIANRARHSPQPTALSKILPGPPTSGAGPLETPEWKASFPFSQKSSGEITDSDISVMLANCSIGSQKIALGSPSRSGAVSAPPPAPSVDMEELGSPAPWRLTEHTGVRPSSRWPQNRPWTAMILARQQEEDQETPPNRWVVSGTRERRDQSRGDLNQSRRHGVVPVAVSGLRRTSPGGFGGERDDASHRVHVAGGSRRREEERFLADGCPGSGSGTSVVRSRPTIGPFCRRSGLLAAVSTEEDDDELEQGEVRNDGGGVGSEGRYLLIAGPDSLHEAASTPRESLAPPDALESGQSSWPSPEVRATSMDRSAFLERQGPALTAVASPVAPAPQHLDARAELATQTSLPQPFAVSPSFSGTPHDGRSVADAPADLRLSSRFGPVSGTSHFASLSEEPEEQTGDVVGKPVGRESSQGPALHLAVLPQNRGPVHLVSTAQDPTQAEVLRMRSSPGRLDIGEPSFTSGSSPSNAPVAYAELPVSPLAPTVSPADHRAGRRYLETLAVSPSLQPRPASGRREEDGKLFQRSEPASPYASSFAGAASPCADGNVHEGNSEPPHAGSAEHLGFACRRPARLGARQESAEGRAERSECRTFGPQTQVLGTRSPLHVTRSLSREPETFRAGKDTLSSFLPVASSPGFFGPPVTYMPEADARAARRPNASRFALRRGAGSLFSASPEVDCGTDTLLGVQLHALPSSSLGLDREAKSVPRDCRASSPSHGLSGASHCASRCRRLSPSGADRQPGTSQALLPVPTEPLPLHYPTGTAARALAAYSRPGTTCSVCSPLSRSRPNSPPSPWTAHQRPDPSGEYGRRSEHGKAEFHSSGPGRPGAAGLASSQVDSPTPGSLTASGSRGQLEGSPDPTGSYIMSQSPPAVSLAPGVLGPVSEEHSIIQPLVLDDTVAELSIPLAISYTVAAEMADRPDR